MKSVLKRWASAMSALAISAALTACSGSIGQQEDVNSAVEEGIQNGDFIETECTTTENETHETSSATADEGSAADPEFIGLTEEEAVRLCEENNYKYMIEHQCIENISNAVGIISKQDVSLNQVNDGNSITQEATYILTVFDDFKPADIPERNYKFQIESFSIISGEKGIDMIGKEFYYDQSGHITKIEIYYGTGIYKSENEGVREIVEANISYNSDYSEVTVECKSSYLEEHYKEMWEKGENLRERYYMPNPDEIPDECFTFQYKDNILFKSNGDTLKSITDLFHTPEMLEQPNYDYYDGRQLPYVFFDKDADNNDNIKITYDSNGNLTEVNYGEMLSDKYTYKEFDTPLDKETVYLNCYISLAVFDIL